MRISEAEDGLKALESLHKAMDEDDPFRIVVIDMKMPGMDGAALARAIKKEDRLAQMRMVLLSSLGDHNDAKHYAENGFNAYLNKPARILELKSVLSQVLMSPESEILKPLTMTTRKSASEALNLFTGRKGQILLAEDNSVNKIVALGILSKFGLRADAVANGAEAVKILELVPYDLVLMDMQMPEMDGYEATAHIRNPQSSVLNHNIPVIAMTANAMSGDREKCLNAGMNGYVSKPIDPLLLANELEKWLTKDDTKESISNDSFKPEAEEQNQSESPIFNRQELIDRVVGDEELAEDIITEFLEDMPLQIKEFKEFVQNKQADKAGFLAHRIVGAAGNLSAKAINEVAYAMEKAANSDNMDQLNSLIPELESQFELIKKAIGESN
jgi:CheY-like chemotaxis protein/HPt (histidine-containing phosphotransfer) domain-containing protein